MAFLFHNCDRDCPDFRLGETGPVPSTARTTSRSKRTESSSRSEKQRLGRWCLGLFVVLALALPGCKTWGQHDEGLRDNKLTEQVRQARVKAELDENGSKPSDDPWMSEKAQKISRNLE
jgi:hypothetical protein